MANPLEKQVRVNTIFPFVFHWADLVRNSSSSRQHNYFRGDFDGNESKFTGFSFYVEVGLKLNNDLIFSCQIKCVSKKKQGSYLGAGSVNYNTILQGKFDGCSCNRPEPGSHSGIPDHEFQCQLNDRSSTSVMQNVLCTSLTDLSLEHGGLLLQLEQLSGCVLHACFPGIGTSCRACLRASSA